MIRNKIKIVADKTARTLAFYFLNEQQKWCSVSNSSVLSRKKYITANIKESSAEIIFIINSVYNTGNRGVDIYFEGSEEDFSILCETIAKTFPDENIACLIQRTNIAVAGKLQSGKSTLITEMGIYKNANYVYSKDTNAEIYTNEDATTVWYEIPGIDIGIENVITAREAFEKLAKKGLTTFVYCLRTSKIETLEEELIHFVSEEYPSIKIILVLTQYLDEDVTAFSEQLKKRMDRTTVIPLLAKSIKTREGIIEAYGLDKLDQAIFEGR